MEKVYMINTIEEFKERYKKAAVVNYDVAKKYGYGLTYRTGKVKHVIEKFRKYKNEYITYPQIQPYSKLTTNYKMFIIKNNKIYELEKSNIDGNYFHIKGEAININIDIFKKVFDVDESKHDKPSNRETEPIYKVYE